MNSQNLNILKLYLLREAARNECSRVRITNDCLKTLFPRERIHYSKLHELAGHMMPIFQDFERKIERKGNKASIILSIEKGKAGIGALHRISSIPTTEEMKHQVGMD